MYAVVKTGGKQFKVEVGETVPVEHLDAAPASTLTLPVLLVSDEGKIVVGEEAAKAQVTAEVVGHGKADKVVVFKFKKRKGYKKLRGHRQDLTLIKITDIVLAGGKRAAGKAADAAATATTVVEKPAKPAARKAPAAKPAAKKAATADKAPAAPAADKKPARKAPAAKAAADAEKKPARARKPAAKKDEKPADSAE